MTEVVDWESLKSKGNEYFVKKEFLSAQEFYSKAILICDDNAILYANRSAANLELGECEQALLDSDKSIQLNPKFVKAYFRKASSLKKLGRSNK